MCLLSQRRPVANQLDVAKDEQHPALCTKDGWYCCSCRLMMPSRNLIDGDGCVHRVCDNCVEVVFIDGNDYWFCTHCHHRRIPSPPQPPPPRLAVALAHEVRSAAQRLNFAVHRWAVLLVENVVVLLFFCDMGTVALQAVNVPNQQGGMSNGTYQNDIRIYVGYQLEHDG